MATSRLTRTRLSIYKPYGYGPYGHIDYVWPYENKFSLRPQHYFLGLGLMIHQQPTRLATTQGTQAQLVGTGIVIPACWVAGIMMPTNW